MSYTLAPLPTRLKIWQQNLNKSDKAQFDLINVPLHKEWDVLLLQEPYIDSFGNTKVTSRWRILYPSSHLADSLTCRSVILVNASLDTNAWAQVPLEGSNELTAIQFRLTQGHCQGSCPSSSGHPHLRPAIPIFVRPDHPHHPVRLAGPTTPYRPLSYSLSRTLVCFYYPSLLGTLNSP